MKRRTLIKYGLMATSASLAPTFASAATGKSPRNKKPFNLLYAPHFEMFQNLAGEDVVSQLHYMHEAGFRAIEDNGMKGRSIAEQQLIGKTLSELGMTMGVFVANNIYWNKPNLTNGDEALRAEFLNGIKESVEVAKRVNAKWMTVVPGHKDLKLEEGYQTANLVETLRQASKILEPHGLVMVLEPLNAWADHPGQFLTKIPQAYEICRAVNSPACKILFDIYHQQIQEGNIIPNIDRAWSEIAYFQVGDNPGRNEPGTGEINYLNVFKHIHSKGYTGIVGMEHGNSKTGRQGELAVIDAYRKVDQFLD